MKIKIKNIPEGYEIRNKKLVKIMATGGSVTNSTLQPVKREDANVEAEKNETVLTDMDEDGFFELYNVGGKRHSGGGTPLNLPEQSFIYSDTRKMKFTKEEMKELGVTSKKRLTPAAVSKKFPINKYMDVLKDESSDEIAITTAEAMIKKNKIKLSQIAFMQEKKKDFEDGLPLAAYPWLLENGVDPKEFEAKLEQKKQQEQQAQAPQGPAGGQGQPSPEEMQQMAMAMQQQGQGMPPQGMPPQGPPQGGQQMPPEMMMAMQQGQQGPPQGMMPPQQMMQEGGGDRDVNTGIFGKPAPLPIYARYGGNPLAAFVYGGDLPRAQEGYFINPSGNEGLTEAELLEQYNKMMEYNQGNSPLEQADNLINWNNARNNDQVNRALERYEGMPPAISARPRTFFGKVGARIGNIFRSDEKDVDPNYKISELQKGGDPFTHELTHEMPQPGLGTGLGMVGSDEYFGGDYKTLAEKQPVEEEVWRDPCEQYGPESKQCWDSKNMSPAWAIDENAALGNKDVTYDDYMQYQNMFYRDDVDELQNKYNQNRWLSDNTGPPQKDMFGNIQVDPLQSLRDKEKKENYLNYRTAFNELERENYWNNERVRNRFSSRDDRTNDLFNSLRGSGQIGGMLTRQKGGDVIDQNQRNVDMMNDIVNCENTVCEYEQWLAQYRLKDIPEVRFMYESYKTKAIDKLKAPNTSTKIMPGHENLKNMPYGNMPGTPPAGSLPGWRETLKGFIPETIFTNPSLIDDEVKEGLNLFGWQVFQEGGSVGTGIDPRQQANMSDEERQIMGLKQALQQLHQAKLQVVQQFQSNPEAAQNPEAQQQLQNVLMQIEQQTYTVQTQLQYIQEKNMMNETTIPLSDFMPGETTAPANQGSSYEYFNPDRLMRKGGSIGRSIPRFPDGGPLTEHTGPESTTFSYEGEDDNGYPVSLNPYYRTSPTSQFLDGVENPNYDADFEQSVDNGIGVHDQFFHIMNSPNFQNVRDEWIKQYQDLDVPGKVKSTDEKKLFKAFNDMNILLNAAFSSGQEFVEGSDLSALGENFSDQLTRIANKMGIEVPTKETIMMYQGMYNSLASAKLTGSPETQALLEQVNINFGDKDGGAYEIEEGSGKYVSDIDGLIGNTTSKQFVSINDDEEIITTEIEHDCDEKTKKLMIQKCMELGASFNEKTCECHKKPTTTPTGKIPPYLTFPGDDLKVGALASIHRDKKYGILQQYDPIQRDPGYVDDRAGVAAATALANQAMQLGNVSDVQGRTQDQIDKIQANRWATNTKIFDNTQAYNVSEINKARELNSGYMSDYQDMVNKVDQEYDNTKIADMMNLVDAETTRMDNADKLHELNLRNPNYYFDPQRHSTIFQNPEALEAYRGNPNAQPITMADAIAECRNTMGIVDEAHLIKCAELRMKSTNNPQGIDYTRGDVNTNTEENSDNNTETSRYGGSYKYGGTIRERDLRNSSNNLRKWIMGIE
jgi:hypothetical protein